MADHHAHLTFVEGWDEGAELCLIDGIRLCILQLTVVIHYMGHQSRGILHIINFLAIFWALSATNSFRINSNVISLCRGMFKKIWKLTTFQAQSMVNWCRDEQNLLTQVCCRRCQSLPYSKLSTRDLPLVQLSHSGLDRLGNSSLCLAAHGVKFAGYLFNSEARINSSQWHIYLL